MEQDTSYGSRSNQLAMNPRTNAYAIVSLICAFVFSPLAIIFGHLSLKQIASTGEQGRGMAIAGLVLGYLSVLALLAYIVIVIVVMGTHTGGTETIKDLNRPL